MAITSFIKSASSKNKVAAVAPSIKPTAKSSEVEIKDNNKSTVKKTEFKVSAMAYAISRSQLRIIY
ncbi:hypothetical protein BGX28_009010 [Mortierella sp. GBA30]|nr:hypothetical protein BGX28_009010 [Mortierella sp. GBA30]